MQLLILMACLLLSVNLFAQETGIKFEHLTIEQAVEQAQKEEQFIFLNCYAEWIKPCVRMDTQVFSTEEVGQYFNANFLNVKMDLDKKENEAFRIKHHLVSYHSLFILNQNGEIVEKRGEYQDVAQLLSMGKSAIAYPFLLSDIVQKVEDSNRSAKVMLKYLENTFSYRDIDKTSILLDEYFLTLNEDEKFGQMAWDLLANYQSNIYSKQFQFFVENRKAYEKRYGTDAAYNFIVRVIAINLVTYEQGSTAYDDLRNIDKKIFKSYLHSEALFAAFYQFGKEEKDKLLWEDFINKFSEYIADRNAQDAMINYYCYYIYENYRTFNDILALEKAKNWSYATVKKNSICCDYKNTYAHLCFDLGQIKEAIKYQEIAIECAKYDTVIWYEKELERYKKAL